MTVTSNEWRKLQKHRKLEDVICELYDRITQLEERILIIEPDASVQSKYPALAEAYREYKIIEKLTVGNEEGIYFEAGK